MASLTEASILTRKFIRYFIYSVTAIILIRATILTGFKIYRYFFPAPPPPPTVGFGKLSKIPFPVKDVSEDISYSLETPTGEFPVLPITTKVYYMPKPFSQLMSLDTAKETAASLDFDASTSQVTETVYQFTHERSPAELKISIVSGVFSISYDLGKDPSPLDSRPLPPEIAASKVKSFLSQAGLMADDLTGPVASEPVKLVDNKIIGAGSLSEANFVRVNIFRKDYDELPCLTSEPDKGNVWFITSGDSQKDKLIIAGEYHYFPVDETKFETYPIKTAQEAWEEFKNGKGYIASMGQNTNSVVVRRIYLAYYDAGVSTQFFQPIIVFEGDKEFVGYVPAVTSEYLDN